MNMIAVVMKERDLRVKRQESGYTVKVWLGEDPENKIRWITYEERRGRIEYGYYSDKSGPGEKPCEGSFDIQTEDPTFPLAQDGKLISLRDAAVIFLLPYMA